MRIQADTFSKQTNLMRYVPKETKDDWQNKS